MKHPFPGPRETAAPATLEDFRIWYAIDRRWRGKWGVAVRLFGLWPSERAQRADQRDADLTYVARFKRSFFLSVKDTNHAWRRPITFRGLEMGGRMPSQPVRLEPAEFTDEDKVIWSRLGMRTNCVAFLFHLALAGISAGSDRRDAQLLLFCRNARAECDRTGVSHCMLCWDGVAVEGFDDPDTGLRDQGLAVLIPKLPQQYR